MKDLLLILLLIPNLIFGCSERKQSGILETSTQTISDDSLMTLVQYRTFQYFWDGAEPTSGLARERIHMDGDYPQNDQNVVTTGGSGFGVMAILVGIERGFITRQEGFERLRHIVGFGKC
jgi:hypothetical protein